MKFALLQINPTVGDIQGNAEKIIQAVNQTQNGEEQAVDLYITSELALLGYPPRDLLLNPSYIDHCWKAVQEIAASLHKFPPLLIGLPTKNTTGMGKGLLNSAVLIQQGKAEKIFHKSLLPNYDVFDETRYFHSAQEAGILKLEIEGHPVRLGITICEDIWNDQIEEDLAYQENYQSNPLEQLAQQNIDYLVNLSASPFIVGKQQTRETMLSKIAQRYQTPLLYINQCGANDDIVFDGRSLALDQEGNLIAKAKAFVEDSLFVDLPHFPSTQNSVSVSHKTFRIEKDDFTPEAEIWQALVTGTRDYLRKCGFKKAVLGLSGGIDSALTAAVAAEAIGPENVTTVLMPSPYSSQGSIDDSLDLAKNLNIQTLTFPIQNLMNSFDQVLEETFQGLPQDTTEENLQSRIRGNLLMALSNKSKALLLTTGNKSELAVGYCTIYGDMNGGLGVIADVPKTMVFRICRWLNEQQEEEIIPIAIIEKPPSAELRPDQKDEDSLPPYDQLDEILRRFIEQHESEQQIVSAGFDSEAVKRVLWLVKIAEFKRKQAAPGIKVTDRAFGTGWRMPIAYRPISQT